jgi:hypothetical protein
MPFTQVDVNLSAGIPLRKVFLATVTRRSTMKKSRGVPQSWNRSEDAS